MFEKAVGGKEARNRFLIPGELVEWTINTTFSQVELYCHDGKPGFRLGSPGTERTVFGIGVTNLTPNRQVICRYWQRSELLRLPLQIDNDFSLVSKLLFRHEM